LKPAQAKISKIPSGKQARHGGTQLWCLLTQEVEIEESQSQASPSQVRMKPYQKKKLKKSKGQGL
jgi:hypothetical protein